VNLYSLLVNGKLIFTLEASAIQAVFQETNQAH